MIKDRNLTRTEIVVVIVVTVIILSFLLITSRSLLYPHSVPYEVFAQKMMKNLCEVQAEWRKKDYDGNGQQDYWCFDVAGFYYAQNEKGTPINYVDIATGKADPLVATNWATASGIYAPYATNGSSRNGYFFSVLTTDGDGEPYLQTTTTADLDGPNANVFDGKKEVKVGNRYKFGFIAWPAVYGQTGNNFFIVNQTGNIYFRDTGYNGGDNGAIIPMTQWPYWGSGNRELPIRWGLPDD